MITTAICCYRNSLIPLTRRDSAADDGGVRESPAWCGVLLYGPPGCGKRSLSRWLAAECRSRLATVNCRQTSILYLSDVVYQAMSDTPSVLYLADVDELTGGEGVDEMAGALDTVAYTRRTMIIASTSFPDHVDASLTTSRRFSKQVTYNAHIQCESKKSPLRTCGNFSKTIGNFSTKFYVPIRRSYIR